MPLDLQREHRLLKFAVKAAVRAIQEKSAGELHRQRAGAFADSQCCSKCWSSVVMMASRRTGGIWL